MRNKVIHAYNSKKKARALIPIPDYLWQFLQTAYAYAYEVLRNVELQPQHKYTKQTKNDYIIQYSNINSLNSLWTKMRKQLNIQNGTIHDLRRTFVTIGIESGIDLYAISNALGHESINTTQIYARVSINKKRHTINPYAVLWNTEIGGHIAGMLEPLTSCVVGL